MGTGYYLLMALVLLFGGISLFAQMHAISENSAKRTKEDLLKKMLKNRDIDSDIYVKYSNEDEK